MGLLMDVFRPTTNRLNDDVAPGQSGPSAAVVQPFRKGGWRRSQSAVRIGGSGSTQTASGRAEEDRQGGTV